jgi:hypothetical protein
MQPRQTTPTPWLETLVRALGLVVVVGLLTQGLQHVTAPRSYLGTILAFNDDTPPEATRGRRPIDVRLVGPMAGVSCTLDLNTMRTTRGSLIVTGEEPDRSVYAIWRGGETAASRGCPAGGMFRLQPAALAELRAAAMGLPSITEVLVLGAGS